MLLTFTICINIKTKEIEVGGCKKKVDTVRKSGWKKGKIVKEVCQT